MAEAIHVHEVTLGETIDGFSVDELMHESRVSKLYRVSHAQHSMPLVMKVPKLSVMLPTSVFTGFETEMRVLSKLRGAYTPKVYSKGDLARAPYLVMEYVEGTMKSTPFMTSILRTMWTSSSWSIEVMNGRYVRMVELG